ncbi:Protein CASP [Morella rubra]|uniref:Protein CASP n=1 Tax=Morella rubra TaxID=262757 RepID=A0A6A1VIA5_9ROSI|nr:Protein CASP [Morella rubra]
MESPHGGSERDKSNPSSSPTPVVSKFWEDFDLEKEKVALDEQGLRIAENQENSQKNRRKLAESTRDFKKAAPEDKLSLFNSLLKGYQEEVDNLTKRAKFGENAFLNIYQKLYEAPDPYPVLASVAEQDLKLSELESENRKMKVELEEFRTEATHLKNQQATIRRLEERNRQLEQQMEEKVKEIVEMKQRSLAEENQKTMEVLKDREQLLQDQLRQAKDSVSNMQKLHELAQSQLFELRAQSDEDRAAKQSEVNLLMDEVERAQTRLLSLEREKVHFSNPAAYILKWIQLVSNLVYYVGFQLF